MNTPYENGYHDGQRDLARRLAAMPWNKVMDEILRIAKEMES